MKVFSAIMLDENVVADHNAPDLLLASSAETLLSKVREHVKANSHLLEMLHVDLAEVDAMSIDAMNEIYCETAPHLFIHADETEI